MTSNRLRLFMMSSVICLAVIALVLTPGSGRLLAHPQATDRFFIGIDDGGDFQRALRDALAKAQEAAGCCDRLITYRVIEVQGQVGGFAGVNQIRITIVASW